MVLTEVHQNFPLIVCGLKRFCYRKFVNLVAVASHLQNRVMRGMNHFSIRTLKFLQAIPLENFFSCLNFQRINQAKISYFRAC